jgi:arginine decarboxylase
MTSEAPRKLDQTRTPILDALAEHRRHDRYGFTPPGHRQGRGAAPATLEALGRQPFQADVLASSGLDDRRSRGGYLKSAEELMADAVGADHAFFSTCGSSLSVKAAMLAVAGDHPGGLLLGRDSHKSIVAGLILGSYPDGSRLNGMPNGTSPTHRHLSRSNRLGKRTQTPPPR